jgi:hypothetical protein
VLVPGTAKNGADLVREELAIKLVPTLSTEPTVTFEEKVAELEMVLLTYISAK